MVSAGSKRETNFHLSCRHVVQRLIKKYGWAMLSEVEFVELVIISTNSNMPQAELEYAAKHHYTIALHHACSQTKDLPRREQGYKEIFHYLYRLAYNRWPDLAEDYIEDITQRALLLTHEQIDRCQKPAAFFTFAAFKLRHAFKQELQARRLPSPDLVPPEVDSQTSVSSHLQEQEAWHLLLTAIEQLPNERQQKAIFLKYFAGLNDKEIAKQLDMSDNNVRVLRSRALVRLRNDEALCSYFRDA